MAKRKSAAPFTPDIRVYNQNAKLLRTLGKPADAALVQIPGTGVIWKICPK